MTKRNQLYRSFINKIDQFAEDTFLNSIKTKKITTIHESLHIAIDTMQIYFGVSGGVEIYMKTLVHALMNGGHQKLRVTLLCRKDQLSNLQLNFSNLVDYYPFRLHDNPLLSAAKAAFITKLKLSNPIDPKYLFPVLHEFLGVDVLHCPVQYFTRTNFNVPAILNLHDLQHLHYPENFSKYELKTRSDLYNRSAAKASAIIASSEFIRQDIIKKMNISESKVFTIPAAFNPNIELGLKSFSPERVQSIYGLPKLFGFYPAQFWKHKNHVKLLEALAIVRDRAPQHDFKLVFTGYRGHSGWADVEIALKKFNLRDHILFLDFIPSEHMGGIYRSATFCIMPSLFEASSYPVIEAQTLGCPAMCSNITSLPELMAEGSGLLFDPTSAEDMAEKMLRWLNDPKDRMAHAQRGQIRALAHNSMAAYARHVTSLYKTVSSSNKLKI